VRVAMTVARGYVSRYEWVSSAVKHDAKTDDESKAIFAEENDKVDEALQQVR
jgi:hypothetical protein